MKLLCFLFKKKPEPKKLTHSQKLLSICEYIGDKFPEYQPEWTKTHEHNALDLLTKVDNLLEMLEIRNVKVNSGWRPVSYNAKIGGAKRSKHITGEAIDLGDKNKIIAISIAHNPHVLEKCDLYIEDPRYTSTWVHFQTKPPRSKKRIFIP